MISDLFVHGLDLDFEPVSLKLCPGDPLLVGQPDRSQVILDWGEEQRLIEVIGFELVIIIATSYIPPGPGSVSSGLGPCPPDLSAL